jgi:hypothetical protein
MMMQMIIVIMGHECMWGTAWGISRRVRGKERVRRGGEDGCTLHIYT